MRITIDLQPEDIKQALEEHIRDQTGFTADVSVDWLNGRYGVTVNLQGDTPGIYVPPVIPTDTDVVKPEPVKRTRRSKEQIEADRLAEQATTNPYNEESVVDATESGITAQEVPYTPDLQDVVPESGLMATIFAEEPEPEEPVQDIFAVEDNSVFAQPVTENVFAIK